MLSLLQLLPGRIVDVEGVLVFALAGAGIRVSRAGDLLSVILAIVAGIILVATQTRVSDAVAARWIRADTFPPTGVAAVVVLSAAVNPNNTISAEALDHLIAGLELTAAGKAPVLVTTTVRQSFPHPIGTLSSEADLSRILGLFGGRVRWISTPPGRSTRDEAITVAKALLPQGMARVAIVASPMHTRRACSAFEAVGFVATCVPARSRSTGGYSPRSLPRDRLAVLGEWIYEAAAIAKYRLKGWL